VFIENLFRAVEDDFRISYLIVAVTVATRSRQNATVLNVVGNVEHIGHCARMVGMARNEGMIVDRILPHRSHRQNYDRHNSNADLHERKSNPKGDYELLWGDVEEAETLLSEPSPEGFDIEGLGKYQQPQCPRCGSFDISYHAGLDKRFALPMLWFASIPIPVPRNEWNCPSCGAVWRDSQPEEAEPESSE
jgi:predicted RNA-binding Zn-ribbon protein involved in translation (DUF1610 family)